MPKIKVGDKIPPLKVRTHQGNELLLGELHEPFVLFFYPKNGTPVCTKEACAFRDAYEDFVEAGATVIGVSSDAVESHERFAATHRLPFQLVSDADGEIRRSLNVPKSLGLFPGRVTYVVDREGVIRHIFNSQMDAQRHVSEALNTLRSLDR